VAAAAAVPARRATSLNAQTTHLGPRVAIGAGAAAVLLAPGVLLLTIVLLVTSPATGALVCASNSANRAGAVPTAVTATTSDGTTITLSHRQLTRAATILDVAADTAGVGRRGARVALMAALTESGLRMLANPTVPTSSSFPNDGVGSDHDSLGLFQMRPSTGWGSIRNLMDPTYQAEAFFGGPGGPNHGSPRGLLDIPEWTALTDGQAAQAVEVSAYPDRYARYGPVADRIIFALTSHTATSGSAAPVESSRVVFPLPAGTWTVSARFGPRLDPITGQPGFHHGTDLAAPARTPIASATDGRVVTAGMVAGTGTITILTSIDGRTTAITYLHMPAAGTDVHPGQIVRAGQVIGTVGSTGHSTGPHLHFQVQPGGTTAAALDSLTWLHAHHATTTRNPGAASTPGGAASACPDG
jgi:murein DD-endopeptidase MepM/ murein hydrolase activator NlpD